MAVEEPRVGELPLVAVPPATPRTVLTVSDLFGIPEGSAVIVRGFASAVRGKGKCGFIVLRTQTHTVQAAAFTNASRPIEIAKFVQQIPIESFVEVHGQWVKAPQPIKTCTFQELEIEIDRCFIVSRAQPPLPVQVLDCQHVTDEGDTLVSQNQRLDFRVLDLRTPANQAIFRIQSKICQFYREYLQGIGFQEIHTPKLISAASEGGASVFEVKYFDRKAFLAQSPQLYKQLCVVSGIPRVFEIGPVFRAESSNTHRHTTEFTGLDGEMAIVDDYHESLDVCKDALASVFRRLQTECADDIETVRAQFPSDAVVINPVVLRFSEGIRILREVGVEVGEMDDLTTEAEKRLGAEVKARFGTDFYVLDGYPASIRPFYTMPDPANPGYSNSYDVFLRGEEIVSGAQRIHEKGKLLECAQQKGVDMTPISAYVDAFSYGAPPHAGFGCGLDRITFLFLGLKNVRRGSLFPRDPQRLTP